MAKKRVFQQERAERTYRGILDEIRIFGSTLDGSGALPLDELIKVQNRVKTGA